MINGIQITIQVAVDGRHIIPTTPPVPINVRITDDNIYRIADDDEYRIID